MINAIVDDHVAVVFDKLPIGGGGGARGQITWYF
jgi:hypothetical protein